MQFIHRLADRFAAFHRLLGGAEAVGFSLGLDVDELPAEVSGDFLRS